MSYVLRPPVDTSGFVENPLTAELDADSNNISNAGTVSATTGDMANVTIGSQVEHTDPAGLVGFYGAPPTPQAAPVPPLVGHGEVGDAINQIVATLQALGLMA